MYVLLLGSLLGVGLWLIATAHKRKLRVWFGGLLIAAAILLVALMTIWAEYLWYDALGFVDRFWTFTLTPVFVVAGGVVLAVVAPFHPVTTFWSAFAAFGHRTGGCRGYRVGSGILAPGPSVSQ